jgi:Fic family protein
LLAQRLGWTHAIPLLGGEAGAGTSARQRRSAASSVATSIETNPERAKSLLAAQARAALRAIDLSAELERRADRLLAVAPKLRAKAADAVVEKLLSDDAIVASEKIAGMSDRGLRRLFDRLVELGAVRELSGRPAFRIYGL